MLSPWPREHGEVPERSIGAVSKTVVPLTGDRGFESLPLRHFPHSWLERTAYPREVVEMALAHTIGNKVEAAYRRGDLFSK